MYKVTIHSLPNELLAGIFYAARGELCKYGSTFEILVSHISRHWRNVALSMTTLWSSIIVQGHHKNKWIHAYLERSQGSGLDLRLDFWQLDSHWQPLDEEILATVAVFSPHAPRFRNVNIKTYREETLSKILAMFHNLEMPMVQKLSVLSEERLGDCDNVPVFTGQQIMRGRAPNLNALHVDTTHCHWIPLTSIRELHLYAAWGGSRKLSLPEFFDILLAPTELTSLIVEGNLIDVPFWPPIEPLPAIKLPHLRSLRVSSPLDFIYEAILSVAAPRLESAWFDLVPTNYIHHFTSTSVKPYSAVRNLAFYTTSSCEQVDSGLLTGVSNIFPNIKFLSVACFGKRCPVLEYLFALDVMPSMLDASVLFPALETIAIRGTPGKHSQPSDSPEIVIGTVCEMASARVSTGQPLKKVLVENRWVTPELLVKLSEIVDVGTFEVSERVEPLCVAGFVPY